MRRWMTTFAVIAQCLAGCGSDSEDAAAAGETVETDAAGPVTDATVETDAAGEICDLTTHQVNLPGPFTCPRSPLTKTITGAGKTFEIFKYEASHPLATAAQAFPCAVSDGIGFEMPAVPTQACSRAGVRPWHSVNWNDAKAACEQWSDGWRLCSLEELARACEGPTGTRYTWGATWEDGQCNLLDAYRDDGTNRTSEAPTGAFEGCTSAEGVADANGNLWEWVSDRDGTDPRRHKYIGAGWKIIAQRHDKSEQTCRTETLVPGISGETYSSGYVGFRCCRDE
jgi:hypothetical protein